MRVTFTTLPAAPDTWARDLHRLTAAATSLAMRGDTYSPEDRADCAAALVALHLHGAAAVPLCTVCLGEHVQTTATHLGAVTTDHGATVHRSPRCYRHRGEDCRTLTGSVRALPTWTTVYGQACNVRRALARRRNRDALHAAEHAGRSAFTPSLPGDAPEVRSTPWGARRTALDMLRMLGLDERTACRKGGALWTAAYAAARSAAGMESREIAEELELSFGTYRNHLSTAAARVPSAAALGLPEHYAALAADDPTETRSAWGLEAGTLRDYIAPEDHAPVTCTATAAALPDTAPDWTSTLHPTTAARLAQGAEIRRARAAAKTADQRATDRMAAGLPATVR